MRGRPWMTLLLAACTTTSREPMPGPTPKPAATPDPPAAAPTKARQPDARPAEDDDGDGGAMPSVDPRWACAADDDCVASCRHGAVAGRWWRATYPGGEACEDGCTSKGTQPPRCDDGTCVARRDDADDAACTELDVPPVEGPGPAHRCRRDRDCVNDCGLGAVNRDWFESTGPHAKCKDGCTSKGTESPKCEAGLCVAYRAGVREESCTRVSIW